MHLETTRELHALERDVERLEHYISLLDERQAQVIRLRDFDGKPWNEIEEVLDKPQRTLSDLRQAAITERAALHGTRYVKWTTRLLPHAVRQF